RGPVEGDGSPTGTARFRRHHLARDRLWDGHLDAAARGRRAGAGVDLGRSPQPRRHPAKLHDEPRRTAATDGAGPAQGIALVRGGRRAGARSPPSRWALRHSGTPARRAVRPHVLGAGADHVSRAGREAPRDRIQTEAPRHGGLTLFGRDVIREMNRLGMIIDVAHLTFEGVRTAVTVSTKPMILSHTVVDVPWPRAVSVEHARLVAARQGVVGVFPVSVGYHG